MTRTYRWARRAVWGTLVVVLSIGCNPLSMIAFLTHRDVKVPAKYPLERQDGDKKNKQDTIVAIFVTPGNISSPEVMGMDTALAAEIEKTFTEVARENKMKLAILPMKEINRYKMKNPNWKITPASTRGQQLGADFVLDMHLTNLSFYQPNSPTQTLYEGHAEVDVDVCNTHAVDTPDRYVHTFSYPKYGFPMDATSKPLPAFRREFLEHLAIELARYHFDYKPSSGIADGR
ncbi:MAG TPA: hypothetical protein VLM40_19315 [Gemmata sp.]|nr:hypothetical protein [Gemmata sp.]